MKAPFLLALSLIIASRTFACAIIKTAEDADGINIADESALIVWDKKTQTEHFIRRANFQTKSKNFGFLVPTPSKPELAQSDNELFTALDEQLKPKIEYQTKVQWNVGSFFMSRRISSTFNAASGEIKVNDGSDMVEVWEQKQVGNYDAAVLRASDAVTLQKWLKKNSYAIQPEIQQWLHFYTAKKWFITAFKIRRIPNSASTSLSPVRLSFKTPRPFYPYHEPASSQKKAVTPRALHVFLLSDERFEGRIESSQRSGNWPARTIYSAPINESDKFDGLGLRKTLDIPKMRLTVFKDLSSPRPAYGDLYFSPSTAQSNITPAPIIRWKYKTRTIPFEVLILGMVVLFLILAKMGMSDSSNEKSPS